MAIQRGEIYFVNLNPVQGRERAGQRPVLVLSIDAINQAPLVITVVVGTKGANVPRLPDQCARNNGRERVADGDGVSLFSSSLA
jgi:mRNA-degrading endonuclease toxin of MazEF toxin-antitoxin module